MRRSVSLRELEGDLASILATVRAGETVAVTVNGLPVLDIVPRRDQRSPWVPAAVLRRIVDETPMDRGLLADLADVRGARIDD
jgi:prevent-host-death family protein